MNGSDLPLDRIGIDRYVAFMLDLVKVAKAFADPTRVRILSALRGGELCVCDLCDGLKIGQSTLSTHLAVIREAGLVRARKDGKWVYYELAASKLPLIRAIFEFFSPGLQSDRDLARDAGRLKNNRLTGVSGSACGPRSSAQSKRKRVCV